ncbi:Polyketide synthase, beta-ketoacyl synthase domain containing protein [Parasponia andersonii]|uniref:beta-ketoacyl-[acyl-carrier-protein] synthase I n=1 Tax=Parasponia andersonii TaxID=3476 RepID=A0A2P5BI41_PARAD|nr:Polyketide synthase, beta-ketoacyl synthase domain containing protein [Parasponia andersonii]
MVTQLGCGVEATWNRLLKGGFGIRALSLDDLMMSSFDKETQLHACEQLTYKVAAIVPCGTKPGQFNEDLWLNYKVECFCFPYSLSCDAFHITQPHADEKGAILAMTRALKQSGLHSKEVDYINAHATLTTPLGDAVEANAIKGIFSDHATSGALALSSTKGIASLTLNLTEPDPMF